MGASQTIDSGPSGPTNGPQPDFAFSSTDATAAFTCSIGGAPRRSPLLGTRNGPVARRLADGDYTFRVTATTPRATRPPRRAPSPWTPSRGCRSTATGQIDDARPTFGFSSTDDAARSALDRHRHAQPAVLGRHERPA
jgi:hypothetical protein